MKRNYETILREHFARYRQMAFITGPRQVGKTTLSMAIDEAVNTRYLSWDDLEDRDLLLAGPASLFGSGIAQRPVYREGIRGAR